MHKALKVSLWSLGAVAAVFTYLVAAEDTRKHWGIVVAFGYCFWLVLKQISDAEKRTEARLDRLEDMLRRQSDEGLSAYEREGLADLISDHRNAKREIDQP